METFESKEEPCKTFSQKTPVVILIAPNVSLQMGGEAMKALLIFKNLADRFPNVIQITHERCEAELSRQEIGSIRFVRDDAVARFLWRSKVLRLLVNVWFSRKAIRLAEEVASEVATDSLKVVIHQTEPNSPVSFRKVSSGYANIIGPINGNVYYPACLQRYESLSAKMRRLLHYPLQRVNRIIFPALRKADWVVAAGGERTTNSLCVAGVPKSRIKETLDCGIDSRLLKTPLICETDPGFRPRTFVHFGRLVFHKGTHLAIEAVAKLDDDTKLDIIGRGPNLSACQKLVEKLGIEERVTFLDWFPSHSDLLDAIRYYAGFVLPSFEDANGIVVQEAMALGVPGICLDWGGPQLLIESGVNGYLVDIENVERTIDCIADRMRDIVEQPELRRFFQKAARSAAKNWEWKGIIDEFSELYEACVSQRS